MRKYVLPLIGTSALLIGAGAAAQVASAGEPANFGAEYSQVYSWAGGLVGTFNVSNPSAEAASTWELSFGLPNGAKVTGVWNAVLTSSHGIYTLKPIARTKTLAGHASADIGIAASATVPVTPVKCVINRKKCKVNAGSLSTFEQVAPDQVEASAPSQAGQSGTDATGGSGSRTSGSSTSGTTRPAAPAKPATTVIAPSVYMPATGRPPLEALATGSGAHALTLASLLPSVDSGCQLKWGGSIDLGRFTSEIRTMVASKVDVIVSIGAGSGIDIAKACGTVAALEKSLLSVLDLGVRNLDFSIPGNLVADNPINILRAQAIKDLQSRFSDLNVTYTVPAAAAGVSNALGGLNLLTAPLSAAKQVGAVIDRVNILPADLGSLGQIGSLLGGLTSGNTLGGLLDTAKGLHEKIMQISGVDAATAWRMIGIIPVIGGNDLLGRNALLGTVGKLISFAKANGLGLVGFLPLDAVGGCAADSLLSAPLLSCLDLTSPAHFFEIANIFNDTLR
jgi:hypothetical protein